MAQYRKKPILVEASQWFKMGDHPAVVSDPKIYDAYITLLTGCGWCPTLEGGHIVRPGDWILTGVRGEHWPCRPDIFAETYEPAA